MSIAYGIKAVNQNAASNIPFIFGFNTARSVADDQLFALWNGPSSAGIKFTVDKDGKLYSAAAVAGDMLYAVAGGIANVRRFDSLAIGTAGKFLRSSGTAPTWSTVTIPDTAVQGDILYASAANVWTALAKGTTRQVLQINAGATLPEWTTDLSVGAITMSGALTMSAAVSQLIPGATSFAVRDSANANNNLLVSNAGLLTVRAGLTVTSGSTTLGGDLKFSSTQNIVPGAATLIFRNNADNANNVIIADAGGVTFRGALSGITTLAMNNTLTITMAGASTGMIVNPGSGQIGIVVQGQTQTGAGQYAIRVATTWSAIGVTCKAISADVIDTNSNAGSRLLELTVSSAEKFGVQKDGTVFIATTQVLSTRRTGWTAWTGTAARGTQNADAPPSVTQVAQAFKALLDDLIAHGIVGP